MLKIWRFYYIKKKVREKQKFSYFKVIRSFALKTLTYSEIVFKKRHESAPSHNAPFLVMRQHSLFS